MKTFKKFLTFDDVGMIPKFNKIASRTQTNIQTIVHNKLYNFPFVPANMDTVISKDMVKKLTELNGMVIYHRFCPIEEKIEMINNYPNLYMSVGISADERNTIDLLISNNLKNYCIDVAHGHSEQVGDIVKHIRSKCYDASIIAGNVCTYEGYKYLVGCGADIIKTGVGGGSCCTTRMKTGFGIPQFSAIVECSQAKKDLELEGVKSWLIADGGIKNPRDAALSVGAGADMVMMGNIFSKTYESAGEKFIKTNNEYHLINLNNLGNLLDLNHEIYSHYRGQASHNFMKSYYGDKKNRVAEGVDFYTKCNGPVESVIDEYSGSLRSSLTYCGSNDLVEYKNKVEFFESTSSYMPESNFRNNQ